VTRRRTHERASIPPSDNRRTTQEIIERILLGRDLREAWLFTQRFCGACTTVHALASARAVETR
jgi:coenzyme F420-reducing hydrogenase alpha subunit